MQPIKVLDQYRRIAQLNATVAQLMANNHEDDLQYRFLQKDFSIQAIVRVEVLKIAFLGVQI